MESIDRFLKRKSPPPNDNLDDLPCDPAHRKRILDYHPNQRDEVRRIYLTRGPCQPRAHIFPQRKIGDFQRRFNPKWFDKYGDWLEYSVEKDEAFCLCCYLFRDHVAKRGGNEAFVTEGFYGWNKADRLASHVGGVGSLHNNAKNKCDYLMRQGQSIIHSLHKQSDIVKNEYRIRLNDSIDTSRFLLHQGLPFRGHDESEKSENKENFLELVRYTAHQNEAIKKVVLNNAPKDNQRK